MTRDLAADLLRHGHHAIPDARQRIAMISATVEVFAAASWSAVERGSTYPRIPARERLRVRIG